MNSSKLGWREGLFLLVVLGVLVGVCWTVGKCQRWDAEIRSASESTDELNQRFREVRQRQFERGELQPGEGPESTRDTPAGYAVRSFAPDAELYAVDPAGNLRDASADKTK